MKTIRNNNTVSLFGTKISLKRTTKFPTEMLLSRADNPHVMQKVLVETQEHAESILGAVGIEYCMTARFIPGELGETLNKTREYPHDNKVPNTYVWVDENGSNTQSDNPNFQFCIHPTETRDEIIAIAEMFDEDAREVFLKQSLRRIDNPPLILGDVLIPLTTKNKAFLKHLDKTENLLFITD